MYEDPIGDICQRIMIFTYCLLMMVALSVYYVYESAKYKLVFIKLAILSMYNEVYYFLLRKGTHIYWRHLYVHLCMWGLVPSITDEDMADSCKRLQLKLADTRYDDHPGMQEWKAKTRAILAEYDNKS